MSYQGSGEGSAGGGVGDNLSVELVGGDGDGRQISLHVGGSGSESGGDGDEEDEEVGLELHGDRMRTVVMSEEELMSLFIRRKMDSACDTMAPPFINTSALR